MVFFFIWRYSLPLLTASVCVCVCVCVLFPRFVLIIINFLCVQDAKLRESLQIGQKDVPLEDKAVSICYGTDMVNIEWMNLVCSDKETARVGLPGCFLSVYWGN